jgi:hypothetical protein
MPLDHIQFQLLVLQKRIYKCAIDIEQIFENLLKTELKGHRMDVDGVHKTVDGMKKNDTLIAQFTTMMDQKHRDMRHIVGLAISAATFYYHQSSLSKAPRMSADYTFWKNIFQTMCRTVYIRPEIYTVRLPLSDVIKIIEGILDSAIYDEIPLNVATIKDMVSSGEPSRKHEKKKSSGRYVEDDRDDDRGDRYTPGKQQQKHSRYRKEQRSAVSSVISEGSDQDINSEYTQVTEIMKRRTKNMSPVGSSSILTHTEDGKMDILIPHDGKRK